jgi:hypothetical protein
LILRNFLNSKGIATNLLFPPATTTVGKGGSGNVGLKSLAAAAFQQSSTGFGNGGGNSRAKGGKKGGRAGVINPILLNYPNDDLPLSQEALQQQQSNYSSPLRYNPGATANEVASSLISMNEVVRKRLREEFDGGKPDDSADEVDTVTNSSVTGDKVQQQAKKKPKRRGGR